MSKNTLTRAVAASPRTSGAESIGARAMTATEASGSVIPNLFDELQREQMEMEALTRQLSERLFPVCEVLPAEPCKVEGEGINGTARVDRQIQEAIYRTRRTIEVIRQVHATLQLP